jgi:hypothetical protein
MQRQWRGCNLPPPGDSNRVLGAVDPPERRRHWRVAPTHLCKSAIRKRGRQRNPDGLTLRLEQSEEFQ